MPEIDFNPLPFFPYKPGADSIYEVVSPSLMGEYERGKWLSESKVPLYFSCPNCSQTRINLAQHPMQGGDHPRISLEPQREMVYRSFFAWTIQCSYCRSIYDIHVGWTEPNNGRMIITLGDIRELKSNPELKKFESVGFTPLSIKPQKYLTNYHKYLLALEYEMEGFKLSLQIQNTLGRFTPERKGLVEFFAPRYPDSATKIVSEVLAKAAADLIPQLAEKGHQLNTSFAFIISSVSLSYTSVSVPISFLTAAQNAQLYSALHQLLDILLHSSPYEDLHASLREANFKVADLLTK
ncbi:MAG: hypothetical protein AAF927_21695 [Bacteroidota bacterium]